MTLPPLPTFLRMSVDISPVQDEAIWEAGVWGNVGPVCSQEGIMRKISVETKSLVPVKVTETFVSSIWTFLMLRIKMNTPQPDSRICPPPAWDDCHGGRWASERVDLTESSLPNSPEAPGDQDPGLVHLCFLAH